MAIEAKGILWVRTTTFLKTHVANLSRTSTATMAWATDPTPPALCTTFFTSHMPRGSFTSSGRLAGFTMHNHFLNRFGSPYELFMSIWFSTSPSVWWYRQKIRCVFRSVNCRLYKRDYIFQFECTSLGKLIAVTSWFFSFWYIKNTPIRNIDWMIIVPFKRVRNLSATSIFFYIVFKFHCGSNNAVNDHKR